MSRDQESAYRVHFDSCNFFVSDLSQHFHTILEHTSNGQCDKASRFSPARLWRETVKVTEVK